MGDDVIYELSEVLLCSYVHGFLNLLHTGAIEFVVRVAIGISLLRNRRHPNDSMSEKTAVELINSFGTLADIAVIASNTTDPSRHLCRYDVDGLLCGMRASTNNISFESD
ncbi:unnamed protein product [Toxocara canis]|uniref:Uncharacterized protein n=1 Tax=Toxocara canis TaxID=6265 RepID=A0A183UUX7_TOXCA|nr:unnamed protein product [Toxocara canis]